MKQCISMNISIIEDDVNIFSNLSITHAEFVIDISKRIDERKLRNFFRFTFLNSAIDCMYIKEDEVLFISMSVSKNALNKELNILYKIDKTSAKYALIDWIKTYLTKTYGI